MKKIVFLLSLMFCATVVWAQNTIDVTAGDWTLICSIDGTVASVVSYMDGQGDLTIPGSVPYNNQYYPVTSIGNYAFGDCNNLTRITIPNSVAEIGQGAFQGCDQLETVTFETSSSLTSIGESAFSGCFLTNITIPSSVNSIGESAFSGCWFSSINIPNSVTEIGGGAFSDCNQLRTVTFETPSRLTSIGDNAFDGCSSLRSINIPGSVESIGEEAFFMSGLESVTFEAPSSLNSIGYNAFLCCWFSRITIPKSVAEIGWGAFHGCFQLATVTFETPSSLTSIGPSVFSDCYSLSSINIPDSVTSIGASAFEGCHSLTSITIPNSVTEIGWGAFSGCYQLATVTFDGTSRLTSIGEEVFSGCSALTSINIPDSVTSIGYRAFRSCSALTSITLPSSVTSIGAEAFNGCSGLTSVTIPDSVTTIEDRAFKGCHNLTSITIPNSVSSIGTSAFEDCSQLKTVYNLSSSTFTPGSDDNGQVAKYAIRVVVPTTSGSGNNAIYQIPDTFNIVLNETDVATDLPESTISEHYNFIYKMDDVWKAKKIVLTDCQDTFNAPERFTATSVTYTRTLTDGNRSTLCLPFTTTIPDDLEVYEFTDFDGYTIYFTEYTGDIEAYKPYLVGKGLAKSTTDFTFTQTDAVFPATPASMTLVTHHDMTFQGVMERTKMSNNNGCWNYGYKDGYFVRSGGSAHVNPFRCYFTWDNAPQGAPQHLDIDTDGGEVGIEQPAADDAAQNGHIRYSNDVYDLMGRMVRKEASDLRGLPKGIYIWRGKKVMAF